VRNFNETIISEYQHSAILCQLITNLNEYLDPLVDLERFYYNVWLIDTARGWGLDVLGRRVGVGRVITAPTTRFFGFNEMGSEGIDGWDSAPWFNGDYLTTNYTLTDNAYRRLILAKAAANITDGSIPALNQMLMNLFPGRGNTYVRDDHPPVDDNFFTFNEQGPNAWGWDQQPWGDFLWVPAKIMTMTYVFEFVLHPTEIAVVTSSGVLPRPTGVFVNYEYQT
jgi:hypothetical protein